MAESQAEERVVEPEELLMQPGTYFNPQTEVLVVVDDSTSLDQEVFNMEAYEGADWVRISDEVPVDEDRRDLLLEEFQTHHHSTTAEVSEAEEKDGDEEAEDKGAAANETAAEDEAPTGGEAGAGAEGSDGDGNGQAEGEDAS